MKSKIRIITIFVFLIVFFTFLPNVNGAPGDLDTTFSQDGKIFHQFGDGVNDYAYASALQPDGKIVVAGTTVYGNRNACGIARYNADGTLDTTFDDDGKRIVHLLDSFECRAVAVQTDGKILIAGWEVRYGAPNASSHLAVVRLNTDGSFDTSFNLDGIATDNRSVNGLDITIQKDGKIVIAGAGLLRLNTDGSPDLTFNGSGIVLVDEIFVLKAAMQPDGKIVAIGYAYHNSQIDFGVYRLNADGSLDTTFDGDGKVITPIAGIDDYVSSLVIQTDGKIVVAGETVLNSVSIPAFVRYNFDGSLDNTFGSGGKVILPVDSKCVLSAVAVQTDGKIIAVGYGANAVTMDAFALVRLNSNGSPDTSFGENGKILTDFSGSFSRSIGIGIQPDGKIISMGLVYTGISIDFVTVRYNPEGSLDTTFDGDGISNTANIGIPPSIATATAVQNDGKIVAVGTSRRNASIHNFTVVRYNADGTLDTSFDNDGMVFASFQTYGNYVTSVAIQTDGKIVVAGYTGSANGTSYSFALMRFNPNGTLDTTFDGDGKVATEGVTYAYGVAIQSDGKIIAAGTSGNNAALVRYNTNGSLDSTFDGDGIVITSIANIPTDVSSIVLQPDGKIITAGAYGFNTASDMAVFRYNPDGSLDSTFDNDGIAVTPVSNKYDYAAAVKIQPDGKIVAAGTSSNYTPQGSFFALVRYNPDGSLDTNFDGDGIVTTSVLSDYYNAGIKAIAIQPDGRILAAGGSSDTSNLARKSALVRYNSNGSLDNSFARANNQNNGTSGLITYDFMNFSNLTLDSFGRAVVVGETEGFFAVGRVVLGNLAGAAASYDFDGDGKTDISIYRPNAGQWWISRSSTGLTSALQFGTVFDRIVPADFSGDGLADIAVWRGSTGEWFILRSEDNSFYSVPFGASSDVPVPADFDGDGRADVAVFRPSDSTWYINKSSGGTLIQTFGASGDVPVAGDYDRDGKTDIAIYRLSAGEWWILKSSTGAVTAYQFGSSSDIPVQGDYTGDGRTDSAVFRPSTGEWFILRSEDSSFYSVRFGAVGDIPAPGDYDGDGKFDTAVFRPSGATWYVNRSTAGLLITAFGTGNDKPVPSAFLP